MDELGMGGTNKNAYTGAVHNPYDLDRISGGSSGGCAVLVASDAAPLAIGTDTGDSIRKPAAYTGVVGVNQLMGVFLVMVLFHMHQVWIMSVTLRQISKMQL